MRSRAVLRAVRSILRPLARFLISEQIPLAAVVEMLKSTLTEEAEKGFALPDKPPSDSRISLLTGVHRKDVRRLRALDEQLGEASELRTSLSARLIADWNALPEFVDDEGIPLPLYRNASRGRPSVRDLAETAGTDIRPQATIDEWLRQGIVEIDDENRIRLKQDAFVPEHDFEEKMQFFERNLAEHLAASVSNMSGEREPFLDQAVYYAGISAASAERLARRARELAMRALRTLNREASALQTADRGRDDAKERVHFGAYFHRAREDARPGDDE